MIRLQKLPEPAKLVAKGAEWTKALLDKIAAGQEPTSTEKTRYRDPVIKSVLEQETNGKCAYCESKLKHVHHGDVEHVYPKSLDPSKSFLWANLTLACEVCNQYKSDRDPLAEHIIDPYDVDPEQHLLFHGGMIFSRGTALGTATRSLLRLDRAELVEIRSQHIEKIMGVYAQVLDVSLPLPVRKALYEDLVQTEGSASAPYTAMARCLFRAMQDALPADM